MCVCVWWGGGGRCRRTDLSPVTLKPERRRPETGGGGCGMEVGAAVGAGGAVHQNGRFMPRCAVTCRRHRGTDFVLWLHLGDRFWLKRGGGGGVGGGGGGGGCWAGGCWTRGGGTPAGLAAGGR